MNFADGGFTVEWDNKQSQRNQTFHFLVILPDDFAGPNTNGGSKVSCAGHITEYLATRTRRFPNSKTILVCKTCGQPFYCTEERGRSNRKYCNKCKETKK
mgnify:CR=1 FL=1